MHFQMFGNWGFKKFGVLKVGIIIQWPQYCIFTHYKVHYNKNDRFGIMSNVEDLEDGVRARLVTNLEWPHKHQKTASCT